MKDSFGIDAKILSRKYVDEIPYTPVDLQLPEDDDSKDL